MGWLVWSQVALSPTEEITMRFGARMMLLACCAGPAMAAMLVTGSGSANAAPLTPAVSGGARFNPHGPGPWGGHGPGQRNCDRRRPERWNVNGTNTVEREWHQYS